MRSHAPTNRRLVTLVTSFEYRLHKYAQASLVRPADAAAVTCLSERRLVVVSYICCNIAALLWLCLVGSRVSTRIYPKRGEVEGLARLLQYAQAINVVRPSVWLLFICVLIINGSLFVVVLCQ